MKSQEPRCIDEHAGGRQITCQVPLKSFSFSVPVVPTAVQATILSCLVAAAISSLACQPLPLPPETTLRAKAAQPFLFS